MVKLIVSLVIVLGICGIVKLIFGTGWPVYIVGGIGIFVWLTINNDFFNR